MHLIRLFTGMFLVVALSAHAQDFNQYKPLTCSGKIPDEFIVSSTQKFKSEIKKIQNQHLKRRDKKKRRLFALESNFVVDHLLRSGLVLFNDPVSTYLDEVAAKLTEADKSFSKKVRVYALRSTAVNAFATDRGTVFVTLGLLAQLENEAQLAYILSHELSHVNRRHALDLFLEAKEIEEKSSRKTVLRESAFDEKLISKNRYSKELEKEADKEGLERFLKTAYSTKTLNTVFDVLKYSYLPFDDEPFAHSFFETRDFKFPEAYWLAQVKPIAGVNEQEDDPKSSHPNIGARRQALNNLLAGAPDRKGQHFLVSETRFVNLRKTARFELPTLNLHTGELAEAIYNAYLLLQKEPSAYAEKCIAKALYLRAKYQNSEAYVYEDQTAGVEGESQQVFNLLSKLDGKESTVLALRYCWTLLEKYPTDPEAKTMTQDLFVELARHVQSLDAFLETMPAVNPAPALADSTAQTNNEKSKYEKISNKQNAPKESWRTTYSEAEYWRAAFIGNTQTESFKAAFEKGQQVYKDRKNRLEYFRSSKGYAELRKKRKNENRNGKRLGIGKIVVVNPFYLKLDVRQDNAVQYIDSEYGQVNFGSLISEIAPKTGLKTTILDVSTLKNTQVDRFNDIRLLNDWFSEQVDYDDLSITPGVQQVRIDSIAAKYDTDYFLWTGVISLREKKNNAALTLVAGIVFYPLLPFAIYSVVKPEYDMLYYAILFDAKTGRRETIKFEYFDKRDTDTLLKAHLYDALLQIRAKEKP